MFYLCFLFSTLWYPLLIYLLPYVVVRILLDDSKVPLFNRDHALILKLRLLATVVASLSLYPFFPPITHHLYSNKPSSLDLFLVLTLLILILSPLLVQNSRMLPVDLRDWQDLRDYIFGPFLEELYYRFVLPRVLFTSHAATLAISCSISFSIAHAHPILFDRVDFREIFPQCLLTFIFSLYLFKLRFLLSDCSVIIQFLACWIVHGLANRAGPPDLTRILNFLQYLCKYSSILFHLFSIL